ncbi:cation diffusion facilitator family transporter [Chelativorans sp. YIM 93263]|uniref:cation diffusion facilitator family transporter n=1 Tax=Chelativorans sp. YIM 93263 TaxID=2906648 RepID=UPI002379C42D|nr:cation diffusion facilitator family transporter [Chelativorans sp. YIM 93263]
MHSHTHHRAVTSSGRGRRLLIVLVLNLGITAAELIGGVVSGSLALLADAAHNLSDAAAVLVSYFAWRISLRKADRRHTFGYARAETVGALVNLTVLVVIGLYLLYEAANRLQAPGELAGGTMLVVGLLALMENAAAAWILRKELHNLNVRSTFLHMAADALSTLGVIVAALAIMAWGSGVSWIDPAITALIALYILIHGTIEMREAVSMLMERAPDDDLDYDAMLKDLKAAPGVADVHHLHAWRPAPEMKAIEMHIAFNETDLARVTAVKEELKTMLRQRYGISHATIEVEYAGSITHDGQLIWKE